MTDLRKEYETASMDVVRFSASDVVRTSGDAPMPVELGDNDLGYASITA